MHAAYFRVFSQVPSVAVDALKHQVSLAPD
jgi:hypothetical protein